MRQNHDGSSGSFGEHYLKHIALGEGCNCAESVLRILAQSPRQGDSIESVRQALRTRLEHVLGWLQARIALQTKDERSDRAR